MLTYLFRDVWVYDGEGNEPVRADVGITGDRVAAVGRLESATAEHVVEAPGLALAPGFIDTHTHCDLTLEACPAAPNLSHQGVTTVVTGSCGSSAAPTRGSRMLSFWDYDVWHDLVHFKYNEPTAIDADEYRNRSQQRRGTSGHWSTFEEFLTALSALGTGVNVVPFVGHNTIRCTVMGPDLAPPQDIQLRQMEAEVAAAMDAGAHGLSSGLDYNPGSVATADEVIALARIAARYGGVYTTHWRGSGIAKGARTEPRGRPRNRIDGIREAILIAEQTGVRLLLSHIHGGYSVRPTPPDQLAVAVADATMAEIDEALRRGLDAAFDVIPSTVGGVLAMPYLASYLAPWLREAGSLDRFSALLRAPDRRAEIRDLIYAGQWWNINPRISPDWSDHLYVELDRGTCSVGQIAAERDLDPVDAMFDLIIAQPDVPAYSHATVSSAGVSAYLSHPRAMVGSDCCTFADDWMIEELPGFRPHGNNFQATPAFLGEYSRADLSRSIEQLTSRPARWLGLEGRGTVAAGSRADVVVFNPELFAAQRVAPGRPRYVDGMQYVLVNGRPVIWEGTLTGDRPGQIVTRR